METEKKQLDEWFEWHRDWKKRRDNAYRETRSIRVNEERQATLKDLQKKYLKEMWDNRKRILGY